MAWLRSRSCSSFWERSSTGVLLALPCSSPTLRHWRRTGDGTFALAGAVACGVRARARRRAGRVGQQPGRARRSSVVLELPCAPARPLSVWRLAASCSTTTAATSPSPCWRHRCRRALLVATLAQAALHAARAAPRLFGAVGILPWSASDSARYHAYWQFYLLPYATLAVAHVLETLGGRMAPARRRFPTRSSSSGSHRDAAAWSVLAAERVRRRGRSASSLRTSSRRRRRRAWSASRVPIGVARRRDARHAQVDRIGVRPSRPAVGPGQLQPGTPPRSPRRGLASCTVPARRRAPGRSDAKRASTRARRACARDGAARARLAATEALHVRVRLGALVRGPGARRRRARALPRARSRGARLRGHLDDARLGRAGSRRRGASAPRPALEARAHRSGRGCSEAPPFPRHRARRPQGTGPRGAADGFGATAAKRSPSST